MDYAAVVGGCVSGSTVLGAQLAGTAPVATVSGALVQLMGTAVQAMLAFDKAVAPDVQRIAYVDPRKDLVTQVEQVARASGASLDSVRLARTAGGRPVAAEDVQQVREKLDSMGARKVSIVVSGRLAPERVSQLLDEGAPVDVFHDVSYIASAAPVSFLPNIRTISDREVPQETEPPPPNPRLRRLL
jgi:nicotinic acid phosphoribosyltransferase